MERLDFQEILKKKFSKHKWEKAVSNMNKVMEV